MYSFYRTVLSSAQPNTTSHYHATSDVMSVLILYIGLARTVYIYTMYDRTFGDFPAKILYTHRICMVLANPNYTVHQNTHSTLVDCQ